MLGPAIAFLPERRRAPGGVIAGRVFGLEHQHAAHARASSAARLAPGHAGTDDGEIVERHLAHARGAPRWSRNSSIAAIARSRTGSTSRRISCARLVRRSSRVRHSAGAARRALIGVGADQLVGAWSRASAPGRATPSSTPGAIQRARSRHRRARPSPSCPAPSPVRAAARATRFRRHSDRHHASADWPRAAGISPGFSLHFHAGRARIADPRSSAARSPAATGNGSGGPAMPSIGADSTSASGLDAHARPPRATPDARPSNAR